MQPTRRRLPGFWTAVLYLLLAAGFVMTIRRFLHGLGAVTNLSDTYPWGLWKGFNVLCGIGLAGGGFTIAAVVHIFNIQRFRPILRATILGAFLGYLFAVTSLVIDLGLPWNIWHPIIMWNPQSVLFEVAWCVMLYSTVLALEFSEAVFERLGWTRAIRIQTGFLIPLVVAGVLLSTLHQSSLGALFLITPGKLHPIWYTPLLPWIFYVSSIAVGLAMIVVTSHLSARAFRRRLEMPLLGEIGRILAGVLAVLLALRVYDLARRGVLATAFSPFYEGWLFQVEFLLGLALPLGLLAWPAVRRSARGLYATSLLVVLGFMVHRLNVSITGFEAAQGGHYVPAFSEFLITLMLLAAGFGAFAVAVRYFEVYPRQATEAHPSLWRGVRPAPAEGVR